MSVPVWIPRTEAELQQALHQRLIQEGHASDIKEQLDTGPKASKSLAVDLASFAIDGGCIYVGIKQHAKTATGPLSLAPIALQGQADRVSQVARSTLIDEPLDVRCQESPCEQRPGYGYLVIIIPPSPAAPHMVDHQYRGRGDATNVILSDAEVRRVHERQHATRVSIEGLLRAELQRDPTPAEKRRNAHLFLLAHPATARPDQLLRAIQRAQRPPAAWLILQPQIKECAQLTAPIVAAAGDGLMATPPVGPVQAMAWWAGRPGQGEHQELVRFGHAERDHGAVVGRRGPRLADFPPHHRWAPLGCRSPAGAGWRGRRGPPGRG